MISLFLIGQTAFGQQVLPLKVAVVEGKDNSSKAHPLDPALTMASKGLAFSTKTVRDYSATLVKRENVDGVLQPSEYIFLKVRNAKPQVPFSVYMYFLKPVEAKGREVIYVDGLNQNKMLVHEGGGGLKGALPNLELDPKGFLAMKGQRYPLTEVGIENLMKQLVQRGQRDRAAGTCKVQFRKGAKINGRLCTLIQVTHPEKRVPYDFHIAQIFVDDQLGMPIRYASYNWPKAEGARPELIEEYTYLNLKINVGLTDLDFDPDNPNYAFKRE
tara:strand:+ start:765 stop:1580 length:816 start_codon:yes stop_codon:yes gene_type:complete